MAKTTDRITIDGVDYMVQDSALKSAIINENGLYCDSETYFNLLKTNDPDFQTGKGYMSNTSEIIDVNNCYITGYIFLRAGKKVTISYALPSTLYLIKVAVYSSGKVWDSTNIVSEETTGTKQYEYTAVNDCYVRVQYWNVSGNITITAQGYSRIRSDAMNLDGMFLYSKDFNMYLSDTPANLIDIYDSDFLVGKAYSGSTNTIVSYNGCNISNYIFLRKDETIKINYTLTNVLYAIKYAVYDNNKTWVSTVPTTEQSTGVKLVQYTATNNCYIRVQFYDVNENVSATEAGIRYFKPQILPIQELTYNVNQFSGKSWVSFGDSITYQNKWQPKIVELLGLEHTNCGIGSTSLSGPYINGDTNLPSFWMPVRLNAVKSADPVLITILGGANDVMQQNLSLGTEAEFGYAMPTDATESQGASDYNPSGDYDVGDYCTKSGVRYECNTEITGGETWNPSHWTAVKNVDTFIGAYSYIIENLLSWKRTLSIVILGTTWATNNGTGHSHGINYTMLSDACRTVAQYYGLPFVDLHGKLGYNKFTMGTGDNAVYSADTIHPNAEGAKQLTKVVLNTFINEVTIH